MNEKEFFCTICQKAKREGQTWFLVTENQWEDRLKVLPWNDSLAAYEGMYCACSVFHVEQLVAHWIVTGSLDYPFAYPAGTAQKTAATHKFPRVAQTADPQATCAIPLGELAIHRETLDRVLLENPTSLVSMLEALVSALDRNRVAEKKPSETVKDEEELLVCTP
jgi:hypothetical protein